MQPCQFDQSGKMSDSSPIADGPTPDDIRAALNRMVASHVFSRSPQLGAFMRFVVEAVLHGKGDRIKAYTIGVEVLRRDVKFDPQLDPIVRVEATRLRRAIERYYSGPGADDPIVIDLPRGSYVPTFRRREIANEPGAPTGSLFERLRDAALARPGLAAVLALALVIVAAGAVGLRSGLGPVASLPPGNGMPTIFIEPLRVTGLPRPGGVTPSLLFEKINDAFARFDTVNVVYWPRGATDTANAAPRSDYRFSGAVDEQGSQASVLFRVADVAEGNVVWSRTFEQISASNEPGAVEERIVVALANALLQSYGVIRARDRAKQLASNVGDPRYRCILETADAIRSFDPVTYERGRECLERLTVSDPGFAVGFAFLALIYNRDFAQEYGERRRDPQALDKALKAAQRAIELQPEDSRAYLALFVVRYSRREFAAAFAAAERTMALNKYDTLALGEYGGRLILTGQVDKGLQLMQRAGESGGLRPNWHYFYLFLGYHLSGYDQLAAQSANQIVADNYPLGLAAKAIAVASGDQDRKRQEIDRLVALAPAWHADPRAELARSIADSAIVDRLVRELAAAGLSGRP